MYIIYIIFIVSLIYLLFVVLNSKSALFFKDKNVWWGSYKQTVFAYSYLWYVSTIRKINNFFYLIYGVPAGHYSSRNRKIAQYFEFHTKCNHFPLILGNTGKHHLCLTSDLLILSRVKMWTANTCTMYRIIILLSIRIKIPLLSSFVFKGVLNYYC